MCLLRAPAPPKKKVGGESKRFQGLKSRLFVERVNASFHQMIRIRLSGILIIKGKIRWTVRVCLKFRGAYV